MKVILMILITTFVVSSSALVVDASPFQEEIFFSQVEKNNLNSNKFTQSKFVDAIMEGDLESFEYMIENGVNPNVYSKNNSYALHYAVYHSNLKMVSILINSGADPNVFDIDGNTPLHYSVDSRIDQKITKVLLDAGALYDVFNRDGKTPLYLAYIGNNIRGIGILRESGAKRFFN